MIATINIFGKSNWAIKITSLLLPGEFTQYDMSDYDTAPVNNEWIIAEESGSMRKNIADTYLNGVTFETLFKGVDDLVGVTVGDGLVVGPGSLIRPTTTIGNQVYVGAGTIIDIGCIIGNNVTIGDNVFIGEATEIEDGQHIASGTVIN
jgi:UDP-3-O-[3-hydroxymyristoyl] glucosamine N-acyltransferase